MVKHFNSLWFLSKYFGLIILSVIAILWIILSNQITYNSDTKIINNNLNQYINQKFKNNLNYSDGLLPNNKNTNYEVNLPSCRLLYMLASYTFEQFLYVQKVLDGLRDICNFGYDITIVIQASSGFSQLDPMYDILANQIYCMRIQDKIPLIVMEHGKIGFGLNSRHRSYMRSHLDDYDYFIYAEEDMIFTYSHLLAFLHAQNQLKIILSKNEWLRYQIGFLRYEDSLTDFHRVTWEYLPHQIHILNIHSSSHQQLGNYIVTNNLNQAINIFSREQLLYLEERCEFLSKPGRNLFFQELRRAQNKEWKYMSVGVSEWSSSFQQTLQCGLRRIIPAKTFQLFMIHHSPNKAQKRRPRKELLTMQNWTLLINEKSKYPLNQIKQYDDIIRNQYNLNLMNLSSLHGKIKWSW